MRIAIASHPGRTVTQHFGGATQFLVYEEIVGKFTLIDARQNIPACQVDEDDHDAHLQKSAEIIKDCDFVIVGRIGPGAHEIVTLNAIQVAVIHDEIDQAIFRLSQSVPYQRFRQKEKTSE